MKDIQKYDVISFDIFDSLLVRTVGKPEDVYLLTGYNCKTRINRAPKDFANDRKAAAFIAAANAINGECTLREIYDNLTGYSVSEKTILMEEELRIEKAVLRANPRIGSLYRACVDAKKKIIAVSDMYLPASFLKDVLKINGYENIDEVFVSCDYLANKQSGTLFKKVEEKTGKKKFLHIGDSWKCDYINSQKRGWDAYHVKKDALPKGTLTQMISARNIDTYRGDYFSKIGYSVLGPLIFEFNKWLKRETELEGVSSILFFSRDGKILKEAYDIMYPEQKHITHYFHISRKAINTATLWMHPDFNNLRHYVEDTYSFTLGTFLKRIGLYNQAEFINQGLDLNKEYFSDLFWQDDRIKGFYDKTLKKKAIENSKQQYDYFITYLKEMIRPGNLAIVDIGWRGSMQERLEELGNSLKEYGLERIQGYYLGIESDETTKKGFLYSSRKQSPNKTVIDAGVGLFETLFLAREGTTMFYQRIDGIVEPVLDDYEIKNQLSIDNLNEIHIGAIDYVHDMSKFLLALENQDGLKQCLDGFKKLCLSPKTEDINKFGKIQFNDTDNQLLINDKGLKYYIRYPRVFMKDYHGAPWKIGFLKKNVSSLVNWKYIYSLSKNMRG